jgi:MYXO-CTERM domain-containing protein
MPETLNSSPVAPSSQPVDDFVGNPEGSAPSSIPSGPISPNTYEVSPVYQVSSVRPVTVSSPVSLLYTGSPDTTSGVGYMPSVLSLNTPSAPANDLFTAAAPETPDVTSDFNNSPLQFAPAFVVPEPRLASVMAVAAALALGILVARRRRKQALSSLQP